MKFQDDISNMNMYIHTDKPKPICPPLFQSWGHNKDINHGNKDAILENKENLRSIQRCNSFYFTLFCISLFLSRFQLLRCSPVKTKISLADVVTPST